jgi:hypothetical protein
VDRDGGAALSVRFPSGRSAREIVVRDTAQLLWMVNLGCIDLNPQHHNHRGLFIYRDKGRFIIADVASSGTRFDDCANFEGPQTLNEPSRSGARA